MPTLLEVIDELVKLPGLRRKQFTTGVQADASGSYAGVANGTDAKRQLVSTDLADLTLAGDGSDVDPSWYQGAYAWLVASGIQRQVAQDGYAASGDASDVTDQASSDEQVGVLTLTRTMGAAQAAGLAGEVHSPFPPMTDDDGAVSLRSWINRALWSMRMRWTLAVVSTGDADLRYALSAYPWITGEYDLIGVRDREILDDQDAWMLPGDHYLRFDGASPYLIIGSAVTEGATFYVDLWRRRKTLVAVTGTASATAVAGAVTAIAVTRGGTYATAPTVTITGAGTGATAHAVLTNGTVSSIVVDTAGSGYATATTTVTLSAGEYATSAVGLVNTDDVCTGAAEEIAAVAYCLICDDLSIREGEGTDSAWALRRQLVEERARPHLQWSQSTGRRPRPVSVSALHGRMISSTTRRRWA